MIEVSKERLDSAFEKDNIDRLIHKLLNGIAKAAVPILLAEIVIAFLLTEKIYFIICLILFALLDAALPFLITFTVIFIYSAVKIVRTSGGLRPALKAFPKAKRTKKYYCLFMNEICSDNTMAEALSLVQSSGGKGYGYISALSHVVCCHSLRCEDDAAETAFEKMKDLPQKDYISRNDHMVTAIDYAIATHNNELFLRTVDEYSDILNQLPERNGEAVSALLTVAAHEQKLLGNYKTALLYLEWCQEYKVKLRQRGEFSNRRPLSNYRIYSNAAVCLDKAELYLLMKDTENADAEIKKADECTAALTCAVPPAFVRERCRIVSHLTNPVI
jgi:hypothetical protein